MTHLLVIMVIALVLARDAVSVPAIHGEGAEHWWVFLSIALLGYALIAGVYELVTRSAARKIDSKGDVRAARRAQRLQGVARLAIIAWHGALIWAPGWLAGSGLAGSGVAAVGAVEFVRAGVGDVIAIDELLVCVPALMALMLLWVSSYKIDRRLREARVLGALERGTDLPPLPTLRGYVADRARIGLLAVLAPAVLILLWSEVLERVWPVFVGNNADPAQDGWLQVTEFAGALVVLALMPLILVRLWRTVPLGAGELRDRLLRMCQQHRVGVSGVRVWRTNDGMVNGAMVGMVPGMRTILLTETLLEKLPTEQVEAVMAHEVAHAKLWHVPWLIAAVLSGVMFGSTLVWWVFLLAEMTGQLQVRSEAAMQEVESLAALASLVVGGSIGLWVFGHVSRRFERQADAFAARQMTSEGALITEEGAGAMAGALGAVAQLNGIEQRTFTFRHGSIWGRRQTLMGTVGVGANALAQDKAARRAKWLVVFMLLGAIVLALLQWVMMGRV